MPSGTPEPSHTTTPTPTPTPSGIEKKEKSGHMITCTSPVNVRDAASSQSRVIGELAKGDQVEKLGEDGGWVKIRYQVRKPGCTKIICQRRTAGKKK